jgi:hypothetical protein
MKWVWRALGVSLLLIVSAGVVALRSVDWYAWSPPIPPIEIQAADPEVARLVDLHVEGGQPTGEGWSCAPGESIQLQVQAAFDKREWTTEPTDAEFRKIVRSPPAPRPKVLTPPLPFAMCDVQIERRSSLGDGRHVEARRYGNFRNTERGECAWNGSIEAPQTPGHYRIRVAFNRREQMTPPSRNTLITVLAYRDLYVRGAP